MGTDIGWTWATAGSSYSAIAGVLAAFTFGAIILILSRSPERGNSTNAGQGEAEASHLFHSFLLAFFSLVMSSLLYAIIEGEEASDRIRVFFLGMGASTVFVLAALQLLTSIIWCVKVYQPHIKLIGAKYIFGGVMLVAAADLIVAHGDFVWVIDKHGSYWFDMHPELALLGVPLLFVVPGALGLVVRLLQRGKKSDQNKRRQRVNRMYTLALVFSGAFTVATAAAYGVFADVNAQVLASAYRVWYSLVAMGIVGLCTSLFIACLPYEE